MLRADHRSFRAMGSRVDLAVVDADDEVTRWAVAEIARLERVWSRFDPASELRALNDAAGSGAVAASADLRQAVDKSLRLWRATDGLFDPTVLDALEASGYDRTFRTLTKHRRSATAAPADAPVVPTPAGVVVDDDRGTISLPDGVHLDLGGVGKGLAADLVAGGLVARGARGACVSVGGDVAVAGTNDDGPWRIPVTDPFDDTIERWHVPLATGAIVQSSRLIRRWWVDGEERHHLIDPRTGHSTMSGLAAVVVVAGEAWWAEGVAKAALLAGPVAGAVLIDRLARGGWMIRDDRAVTIAGRVNLGHVA